MDQLDLLPEAVLVLDEQHVVRRANDRARALLGLTDTAVGQQLGSVLTLLHASGRPCPEPLPPRGTAQRLAERVLRVELPDGRRRAVALAGRWQPDGGIVLSFRSAGRREAHDTRRSDLVAMVAHEVRSPLTSVRGFTRTLLARWEHFSDEQRRTMLATVATDADRVTRLLEELLQVSRIDVDRVQLQRTTVDVGQLAKAVATKATFRPDGHDRRIDVGVEDPPAVARVDRDRIEQVLTNLVDNALRYAPDSTISITVTTTDVALDVVVADDGPGIDPDQHETIFHKFGRGREVRRSGTGLGLFISRGLVRAHGGDVTLDSSPGHGARFRIHLPERTD